jgi:hypothetical protein
VKYQHTQNITIIVAAVVAIVFIAASASNYRYAAKVDTTARTLD